MGAGAERVERLDHGRLQKAKRTPQGGLRVPAYLTRIGVFTYTRGDGTKVRELRSPEEVFKADSLASLQGAPVTDMHPSESVKAENWKKYAVGHVSEQIKQDGCFVAADLTIQDADIVKAIEQGARKELSCGYSCTIDPTPGVYEGERYDAIQRDIEYNHAALGPSNWGRAGKEVRLRLDASDAIQDVAVNEEIKTMTRIRIDGIEYTIDNETAAQAIDKHTKVLEAKLAETQQKLDALQGQSDAQCDEIKRVKDELARSTNNDAMELRVRERVELITRAQSVLGSEAKLDGLNERQIMETALRADNAELSLDELHHSDDYVRGMFEHFVSTHSAGAVRNDGLARSREVIRDVATHTDGAEVYEAWQKARKRDADAWKLPLSASR